MWAMSEKTFLQMAKISGETKVEREQMAAREYLPCPPWYRRHVGLGCQATLFSLLSALSAPNIEGFQKGVLLPKLALPSRLTLPTDEVVTWLFPI